MKKIKYFSIMLGSSICLTVSSSVFANTCQNKMIPFEKQINKNSEWNGYLTTQNGGNINTIAQNFKNLHCSTLKSSYHAPFYKKVSCDFFKPTLHNGGYLADSSHPATFRITGCKMKLIKAPKHPTKLHPTPPSPGPDQH